MPNSKLFEAEIEILDLLEYQHILSKGYQCILHIHTVAYDCVAKSFSKNMARIETKIPICLEKKDANSNLGRF
jgi:translation elongation factor EF-1alpha